MSDGRELTRLVILDGQTWPAGSVPPAEVAARITNPRCWAGVEDELGLPWNPEGAPASTEPTNLITPVDPPRVPAAVVDQAGPKQVAEDEPPHGSPATGDRSLPEPPRAGKGASAANWLAYAGQFNVDVAADMGRDDIIALLKNDGHIQ